MPNDKKGAEPQGPDHLRGLRECARIWGLDRNALGALLDSGEIGYVRPTGKERKIPDSEMVRWIARTVIRRADADG